MEKTIKVLGRKFSDTVVFLRRFPWGEDFSWKEFSLAFCVKAFVTDSLPAFGWY